MWASKALLGGAESRSSSESFSSNTDQDWGSASERQQRSSRSGAGWVKLPARLSTPAHACEILCRQAGGEGWVRGRQRGRAVKPVR